MSLADACSDFMSAYVQDKEPIKRAATELARQLERYGAYQVDALRMAVKNVLAHPDDDWAVRWLLSLAECVRDFYDSSHPDDGDLKRWCDRYEHRLEAWLKTEGGSDVH